MNYVQEMVELARALLDDSKDGGGPYLLHRNRKTAPSPAPAAGTSLSSLHH